MRKLLFAALVLLGSTGVLAQQGVEFRPLTFEQALQVSAAEGKPLFIDCYTTWCSPCKMMAEQVFPLPAAGAYFNPRFVCVKFDMESEGDGKDIAKRYKVGSFPTFLIIDGQGAELHRVMGANELPTFIERLEAGLNLPESVAELAKQYHAGTINEADLRAYHKYLLSQGGAAAKLAEETGSRLLGMLTPEQLVQAENWPLVKERMADPKENMMAFAIAHQQELRDNIGADEVNNALSLPFDIAFYYMIVNAPTPLMKGSMPVLRERVPKIDVPNKEYLATMLALADARINGRAQEYFDLFEAAAAVLPAQTIVNLCIGAIDLSSGNKALLTSFGDVMAKARDAQTDPSTRTYFNNVALHYHRIGTVGTVWNEFGGFDTSLAEAVAESKPLFIYLGDGAMDAVFAEERVGDFFNQRFISMRVDPASELVRRFGVSQLPGYLILDLDGSVHHRFEGVLTADELIANAAKAFASGWSAGRN